MAAQNKAAFYLEKKAYPFEIKDAPMPSPKPHQLTIRVHACAVNPVDQGIQKMGMIIEQFPAVLGMDAAGIVTAVGSNVKEFKVGDRVVGSCDQETPDMLCGAFQLYTNLHGNLTALLPEKIEFKDACVLPLGLDTAATALFEPYLLGLPFPQVETPKPTGKTLFLWGASSSVGSCGLQAAKAAGIEVAVTAGKHNLGYCKEIGADHAFDYKSETLVEDVVEALKGKEFMGVFTAVMSEDSYIKGAEICHRLGGKQMVATVLPSAMFYDKPLPHGVEMGYSKLYCFSETSSRLRC
jgi:NADPH:quinone reductase-like Zn-dependent oxidoreductase